MQNRKKSPVEWFQSLTTLQKTMVIGGVGLVIGVIIFALVYQSGDDGEYIAEDATHEDEQLVDGAEEDSEGTAHDNTQPLTEEDQAIQDEYEAEKEDDYNKIVDGEIVDGDEDADDSNSNPDKSNDEDDGSENGSTSEETADTDPGSEGFTKGGNLADKDFDRMETPSDASYQHPTNYTKSDLEDMIEAFYSATLYPMTDENKE